MADLRIKVRIGEWPNEVPDPTPARVFDAKPPFSLLKTIDRGPITNHVNIVRNARGQFAYVTVGGLNEVQAWRKGFSYAAE